MSFSKEQKILDKHTKLWKLKFIRKLPETHSSYIYEAYYQDSPAILKIFKDHSDEAKSSHILSCYSGNGAVRLLDSTDSAVLLEKLSPGTTLEKLAKKDDPNATQIFAEVLKNLHSTPQPANINEINLLVKDFDNYLASKNKKFSEARILEAKKIFLELCRSQKKMVLLHGDLHHYNILKDNKHGWVAIDPKGYIGESECEVAAFLRNPVEIPNLFISKQIILNRINILEENLGLDRERMLNWSYVLVILAICYGAHKTAYIENWLKFANIIYDML